jgi:hypothetical protein
MKHTVLPGSVKVLCALVIGAAACTPGQVGSGGGGPSPGNPGGQQPPAGGGNNPNPGNMTGGGNGGGNMGGGNQMPVPPGTASAGVAPLRRLTADQYRNTVRDLLGLADRPAMSLPADDAIADRFLSNTTSAVKGVDLDRYADAADTLAKAAITPENLARLVPCDPRRRLRPPVHRTLRPPRLPPAADRRRDRTPGEGARRGR